MVRQSEFAKRKKPQKKTRKIKNKMFDEEQGFTLNDLGRRLANIIRIGTIFEIDFETAKARVKIGDL